MFQSIEIEFTQTAEERNDYSFNAPEAGVRQEWACENGRGVFKRRTDGSWMQLTGTGQTPFFRSADQFRKHLREYCELRGCKIVGTSGWM